MWQLPFLFTSHQIKKKNFFQKLVFSGPDQQRVRIDAEWAESHGFTLQQNLQQGSRAEFGGASGERRETTKVGASQQRTVNHECGLAGEHGGCHKHQQQGPTDQRW